MSSDSLDLSGTRLHRPIALALYCLLSGPYGMIFYGLNVARRGGVSTGYWLVGVATFAFVLNLWAEMWAILACSDLTRSARAVAGLIGLLVAIAVYRGERRPYADALARGARPARWWPPFVMLLLILLVAAAITEFAEPNCEKASASSR